MRHAWKYAISISAILIFEFVCDISHRFPLYQFSLYSHCYDRKYQQSARCPFANCNKCARKDDGGCGETLSFPTPPHRSIVFLFDLSSGLPFFVTNTTPLFIFCSAIYFFRILQSWLGINTVLCLPLLCISARPQLTASMQGNKNCPTIAKAEEAAFFTSDGNGKPAGIVYQAEVGKVMTMSVPNA